MVLILAKVISSIVICTILYQRSRSNEKQGPDSGEEMDEATFKKMGNKVYLSMFPIFYTGSFRLLSSTDFNTLMLQGYLWEIFTVVMPFFIVEVMTNLREEDITGIQRLAMIVKCLWLLLFLVELVLMLFEINRVRNYQARNVVGYNQSTPQQIRQKYAKRSQ